MWNLCKCNCWLIIEVILRNARCNNKVYWHCSLVDRYQCSGRAFHLYLQNGCTTMNMEAAGSSKNCWHLFTWLQYVISRGPAILILITMRTTYFIYFFLMDCFQKNVQNLKTYSYAIMLSHFCDKATDFVAVLLSFVVKHGNV